MTQAPISENLGVDFLRGNGITTVTIISEGDVQTFTDNDSGETKRRLLVGIDYAGRKDGDPEKWSMNSSSMRTLAKVFESKDSKDWMGCPIELQLAKSGKYEYIAVNELATIKHKAARKTQSELP